MALPCKRVRQEGYPSGMGLLQLFEAQKKGPAALPLGRLQIPNGSIVLFFDGFGYPGMRLPPAVLNGLLRYLPVCPSESSSQGLVSGMIRQAGSLPF